MTLLPDAEELLTAARGVRPGLVRQLPAHVSLLYPGPAADTPEQEIHRAVHPVPAEAEVTRLITGQGGFVGAAVPELDPASTRLRESFSTVLPYEGRYGSTPEMHLTIALGADDDELAQVRASVADMLPCRSRVLGPYFVQQTSTGWMPIGRPH